jgi:hypothetical protein|tara:strand:+ start:116 stop:1129 length:1014 start_codon:yes stop_codon:yes gene_type:complete
MSDKIPAEELRIVYGQIVRGCTFFHSKKFGDIAIKHLTQYDTELLDIKKEKYKRIAEKEGLPTEKERIQDLIKEELWTRQNELDIESSLKFISKMEDTKGKMALKSEIRRIAASVEEEEKKLTALLEEKKALVGLTSESYSDKKVNDYFIYLSLYRDDKFEKPLFSEPEFDEISENDLTALIVHFNQATRSFAQINLKRIALSHFFLNNFYLCKDNPFIYFGKAIVDLTYHQADLFSFGRYFKNVMSEMKSPLTNEMMDNPDLLTEQHGIEQNKDSVLKDTADSGTASTVVGATKDDLESLGVAATQNMGETVDLNDELSKKGGTMSMEDIIKLHGQ